MFGPMLEALIKDAGGLIKEAGGLNNYLTDMQSANDLLRKQVQTLNTALIRAEVAASRAIELLGDANDDLTVKLYTLKQQNAQLLEAKAGSA